MKDIFIFEGKKYISARRASEISDYAADYIGQLCRADKLDCRMVGRSWFVTEESVRLHQENVLHDEVYRNRVQNLKGAKKEEKPIDALISYEKDVRPLLPELVSLPDAGLSLATDSSSSATRDNDQSTDGDSSSQTEFTTSHAEFVRSIILRRALNAAIILTLCIGVVVGGAYFLGSSSTDSNAQADASSASVYDSVQSIARFIRGGFDSLLAIFGHGPEVAINQGSPSNFTSAGVNRSGMPFSDNGSASSSEGVAILPSSGAQVSDDAAKKKIQSTFSDQVDIHPDLSGTTGVITPVFKAAKGKGFLYVMVPVKNASSP